MIVPVSDPYGVGESVAEFVADDSMAPDDRLDEYEHAASTACAPLRVTPRDIDGFTGRIRAEQVGGLLVADIRSAPVVVQRTGKLITSTDNELYKVALHVSGSAIISQDGRQHELQPGDLVVYDTTRPYALDFSLDYRTIVICCPRRYLAPNADALRQITAVPVSTHTGVRRLVASFFNGLTNELGSNVEEGGVHLADSLLDMVGMAFLGPDFRQEGTRSTLLDRVIAHCEANLADPCLSVHSVAKAHGVSRRYLHKLFASQDQTLAAWIRSRRLDRIRRDLENPMFARRTVAAVAARWGMLDAARVSKLFRTTYGISPSEYRRHALTARHTFAGECAG